MSGSKKPQGLRSKLVNAYDLSDSDTPEPERFINDLPQRTSPDESQNITKMTERRALMSQQTSRESKSDHVKKLKDLTDSSDNSESDSNDIDNIEGGRNRKRIRNQGNLVIPIEGAYDPQQFTNLQVSPEMTELFQHILRYAPQKIDIDYKLKPFLPDYIPAVGDIDAFIKVVTPEYNLKGEKLPEKTIDKIAELGLIVLDEPSPNQSDPALLHLQLRAASKSNSAKQTMVVKKLDNAEKNVKAVEKWIKDVSDLHQSKPLPNVHYTKSMPDIDTIMQEWPEKMESKLNEVGFPPSTIDCPLSQYVDIICNLFDIPIQPGSDLNDKIQSLHVLFTLYSAVKSSQIFVENESIIK
ncbi:intraflagellar transport 46 isoform X2 [Arctopsyche grandis]